MESKKFWVVWNPGGRNPSFIHSTEASAMMESRRLADIHKNTKFYVLEAVQASEHKTVVTERLS